MSEVGESAETDALREVAQKATPGRWKLWGMTVMADQDGSSNVDTAVEVAHTSCRDEHGKPRTWDAQHIANFDPQSALALLDRLERAESALARVDAVLEANRDAVESSSTALWALFNQAARNPLASTSDRGAPVNAEIEALRMRADRAEKRLRTAVADACPGPHNPVQHRDHLRPWCGTCGRTQRGEQAVSSG